MAEEVFISLETLGRGAAVELFNTELRKVLDNILDPNTEAAAKRSVTLTFTIKPLDDRSYGPAMIDVKSKLAPMKGVGIPIYIGRHGGQAVATERDTRQLSFEDNVLSMKQEGGSNV